MGWKCASFVWQNATFRIGRREPRPRHAQHVNLSHCLLTQLGGIVIGLNIDWIRFTRARNARRARVPTAVRARLSDRSPRTRLNVRRIRNRDLPFGLLHADILTISYPTAFYLPLSISPISPYPPTAARLSSRVFPSICIFLCMINNPNDGPSDKQFDLHRIRVHYPPMCKYD